MFFVHLIDVFHGLVDSFTKRSLMRLKKIHVKMLIRIAVYNR